MVKAQRKFKEELLALAAEAFAAAAAHRAERDANKAQAAAQRARGIELRRKAERAPVQESPVGSIGFRRTPPKLTTRQWPWQQALARKGWTITDWVARQKPGSIGEATARSWVKPSAKRPCPGYWADRIAEEFTPRDAKGRPTGPSEVPAEDASWPHGIKRD